MSKKTKPNSADLKQANIILEACMIYYNYFIPVHDDGMTASEKAGTKPPSWLIPLLKQYRERKQILREKLGSSKDPMYMFNTMVPKMISTILENKNADKDDRARVVKMIMNELSDESKREEWEDSRSASPASAERENIIVSTDDPYLPGVTKVIIPYATTYIGRNMKRVRSALRILISKRLSVVFNGQDCEVEIEPYAIPDREAEAFAIFANHVKEEPVHGTKLGLILIRGSTLVLTSLNQERHRALKDIMNSKLGRFLELRKEGKDVELF